MSLIEQAAKRLEELRRAGAASPEEPADSEAQPSDGDQTPTPEAVVHALDAQAALAGLKPTVQQGRREGYGEPTGTVPTALRTSPKRVEIDLAQLRARGYLTPDTPKSQTADEFRVIKRPIIRNALGKNDAKARNRNLVMVTSALPGEGKTFTAVNLAMSIAMELNNTVLLVDADVAHPAIPSLLGAPSEPGLLDLLTRDGVDVADALLRTNVEKLALIPTGSRQRRATELLASEQMARLLREFASRYPDRIVIFDSPPLLATTEARVLATHMGQIVMVVAADSTTQHAVSAALGTIESCEIVLMMLNKASQTDVGAYYGYYSDGDET